MYFSKGLRIGQINASSQHRHFAEIEALLINENIDILAVTETWLTLNFNDAPYIIDGFHFTRNDRGLPSETGKRDYV